MTEPTERLTAALADRYRVLRRVGEGGMATVYLAEDLRHDRKVAVKVLRPELAAVIGAERFLTEIKTTANLQHPHILALYDSGEADSYLFYVMPFVEGESLRDRLEREKQLPVAEATRVAGEVASALDYAHRQGVIHRDIKPENILLHDGRALVADFGIARAASQAGGTRLTETGMSLGTPHYMSPEQAMGERELDARSDVYALGCVLYEMLAGEPPFTGPTAQAIVAKVMTAAPEPITTYRATVPAHVAGAITTALQKLPADRFTSAAEFADTLSGARPGRLPEPQARSSRTPRSGLVAAVIAIVALAVGWLVGRSEARSGSGALRPMPSHLAIPVPLLGGSGGSGETRQLSITADGSTIAYVIEEEGTGNTIVKRRLDELEATPIPGVEGRFNPSLSPDGRYVMTSGLAGQRNILRRVPMDGGPQSPVRLATESYSNRPRPVWHPDGSVWFTELANGTVSRFDPETDSTVVMLSDLAGLVLNQILPDGRTGLVVGAPIGTNSGPLELLDLATGESRTVLDFPVTEGRYTVGYLVFVLPDGTMQAVAYDLDGAQVVGPPTTLATGVSLTGNGIAQFDVSATGTVVYITESPRELVLVDRTGLTRPATAQRENYHAPVFSPSGTRIAFDFTSADGRDIWMLDLDQGVMTRVTTVRDGHDPVWSRDGHYIHYTTAQTGTFSTFRSRAGAGGGISDLLLQDVRLGFTGYPTPSGAILTVVNGLQPESGNDLALIDPDDPEAWVTVVASPFPDQFPAQSPDGRWLAYVSTLSGEREVYLRPMDGEGEQVQVSINGGTEPAWNPNGRELFYRHDEADGTVMMAAAIETDPSLRVGARTTLFGVSLMAAANPHRNYDVSPDGQTFVMVRRSPATRIMVIQQLAELMRRSGDGGSR
jgi:serine/threonine-protein kinase